jgi:hypothetical protein
MGQGPLRAGRVIAARLPPICAQAADDSTREPLQSTSCRTSYRRVRVAATKCRRSRSVEPHVRRQSETYRRRISGPPLDRIDIHVDVPRVERREMTSSRQRVEEARRRPYITARMGTRQVCEHCEADSDSQVLLRQAMDVLGFSTRAYTKTLHVARTIADLEAAEAMAPTTSARPSTPGAGQKAGASVASSAGGLRPTCRLFAHRRFRASAKGLAFAVACNAARSSIPARVAAASVRPPQAGLIFWFTRKRLSGSYLRFTSARRL